MSHISLQMAVAMTSRYRANKENILDPLFRNQNNLSICETFDRKDFDDLLAQNDCKKIRIYFGMDATNFKVRVVAVGVDSNDDDILTTGSEVIIEQGALCPPICPAASPLNS